MTRRGEPPQTRLMMSFVALLRAVNVGGTGKLAMSDLASLCEAAGLQSVRTYIASGNVVFRSAQTEQDIKAALEAHLHRCAGKPVGVLIRTAAEIADILSRNPFAQAPANRVVAIFLDQPAPASALADVTGRTDEQLHLNHREIYVHYPRGIGTSKLRIPAADVGTARNLNTIAKLATMAT